ncbi:MORN repeat-containing protein 5-like isoform X2 [Zophobas morio]|uniref:MORN repeat-containing protein 5-like isoform X2 n=2 Tax=Zophobas morio TaxID=2755281 RepID=UPI003082CA1A
MNEFSLNHSMGELNKIWAQMVKAGEETVQPVVAPTVKDTHKEEFCTGNLFIGKTNEFGMTDNGKYLYSFGVDYEGGFEDGMFHGEGTLIYPMGQKLDGIWEKGRMVDYKFSNVDGLDYEDKWKYCMMPDRRFNVSIREGLQPAGREFMTNQQPERQIEPGCYDTGDGFYNPLTRSVILSRDPADYENVEPRVAVDDESEPEDLWVNGVTMVVESRHEWIVKHCRKAWDEPAGYRPDLYEDWITGRKKELEDLELKYGSRKSSTTDEGDSDNLTASDKYSVDSGEKKSLDYAGTGRKLSMA